MARKGPKFYAVRVGRKPGVYDTWDETEKLVAGFRGAVHKSFPTRQAAIKWLNAGGSSYTTNPQASTVQAFQNSPANRFSSHDPADERFDAGGGSSYTTGPLANTGQVSQIPPDLTIPQVYPPRQDSYQKSRPDPTPPAPAAASTPSPAPPPAKRAKLNPAPAVQQAPTTTSKNSNNDIAVVYTDGAAPGNGKAHAQAGIGVWFGANDPRNISARLPGPVQTNQRAELTAILYALEAFPLTTSVEIRTDSQYSIDCVTRWYLGWVENGWRSSKGEPVKNDDIIKPIRARIDSRDAAGASTRFTKVAGHSGEPGNDQADLLAVAGAQLPAVS